MSSTDDTPRKRRAARALRIVQDRGRLPADAGQGGTPGPNAGRAAPKPAVPAAAKGSSIPRGGKGGPEAALAPRQPGPEITPWEWVSDALRIDIVALNRRRRRNFLLRLLFFVMVPTLIATCYVFFYATPRYVSQFQITYQSYAQPGSGASSGGGLSSIVQSGLFGGGGGSSTDMLSVLASYLQSTALLQKLNKEFDLRAHYSSPRVDWLDRMPADASSEQFLNYFRKRVSVDEMFGGYLAVSVEAFDPKFAKAVAGAMARNADEMVETMTRRARVEASKETKAELQKAQSQLVQATLAVTNFQNKHQNFNPTKAAAQFDTIIGSLNTQLALARSELINARTFLNENAPSVVALKSKIDAFQKQIAAERQRLANNQAGQPHDVTSAAVTGTESEPYSKLVAAYTRLTLEEKFATDRYLAAKKAYQSAQADLVSKENYVETFVPPNLPQQSTSPSAEFYIVSVFLASLVLYAIGSVLAGAFREQAGI